MSLKKFNKKEYQKEYYRKWEENNPEYHKKWRENNPEKWRESYRKAHVKWATNNPEKARESYRKASIKWRENNPEKVKEKDRLRRENNPEYYNKWRKAKLKTDPNFRLHCNMRSAISNVLAGRRKSASTMNIIGCSVEELFQHLENCESWEPWMTRENYGKNGWDVDHIIAIANWDANCPLQFILCWDKSNLQPMEHIANLKKGTA